MIVGHALSSISAVSSVGLAVILNAGLTTCDEVPGHADYIRAGLGYEGPVHITQKQYKYNTSTKSVVATGTGNVPTSALDLVAASSCSSSWSSYSSAASKNIVIKLVTSTVYTTLTTKLTYGTGDVYTTEPVYDIPVAHGNFTATRTEERVLNITSTTKTNVDQTLNATIATAGPTCSLITPKECSKLYVSYISSLGLPVNASVPDVTPVPTNSPPCPTYYYKPFSTCTKSFVTSYRNDCTIKGHSVQLFYFPTQTAPASADRAPSNATATITAPPTVVYEYAPGTTFTSPSVYLKFDYLSAERLWQGNDAVRCSICDEQGCRLRAVDGGQERNREGTSVQGQLVSMAPEEVSSIVLNFNDQEASSMISTMAHGLPGYANVMQKVVGNFDIVAKRLSLDDVQHPPPEAYYMQPLDNAPGCDLSAPQPQCSTIFEGAYRALISLPQQVTGFQGAWKSCLPAIYGVYDPPIALTRASIADGATLPGYKPTAKQPQNTQTPQKPQPVDMPQIPPVARPTALPNELPAQNGGNSRPAQPTLPKSGNSPNGGDNNAGILINHAGSDTNNGAGSDKGRVNSGNNGVEVGVTEGESPNDRNNGPSGDAHAGGGVGADNHDTSKHDGTNGPSGNTNGGGGARINDSDDRPSSRPGGASSDTNGGGGVRINDSGDRPSSRPGGASSDTNGGGGAGTNDSNDNSNSRIGGPSGNTNAGEGAGTKIHPGSLSNGDGGASGSTTGGSHSPGGSDTDSDHGNGGGAYDGGSGEPSHTSASPTTSRRPSGKGTSTTDSGDGASTSPDSTSSSPLASAALARAVIPLLALCFSFVLSTSWFLVP